MKRRPPRNGVTINKDNVLLVDGNALLKFGYHGAKNEYNHFGEHIGGLYQFLTILRKLLDNTTYHRVFVFWDGPLSGKLRYDIYKDYKSNRDKNFETGTYSQDEDIIRQKKLICYFLDQVFIRQLEDRIIESDDFIGHYCKLNNGKTNVTICTIDRDMVQLISKDVRVYLCDLREYITLDNYQEYFKHHQSNALLIKVLEGDNGDCVKGVKGVKQKTLLNLFPSLSERSVSLGEVISEAKILQSKRIEEKKKPLASLTNIINGISVNLTGKELYQTNTILMDLKNPLMTNKSISDFDDILLSPLNPNGRDMKNIVMLMKKNGLDRLIDERRFVDYMLPYKRLANKEKEFYENSLIE